MGRSFIEKLVSRYRLDVSGVVHVGGHFGQESPIYERMGVRHQLWFEPQPHAYERLRAAVPTRDSVRCVNAACGPAPGTITLNRVDTNDGGLSSVFEPTELTTQLFNARVTERIEVPMVTIDQQLSELGPEAGMFNLLVMDVQGYELEVLRGAGGALADSIDYVISEVSRREVYRGGCMEHELDAELEPHGLVRVYTRLSLAEHGNALWIRRSRLGPMLRARLATLGPKVRRSKRRHAERLRSIEHAASESQT